jgi:tetratricopeptide (TPR) repeat protein
MNEIRVLLDKIFLNRDDATSHLELGVCYKKRGEYAKAMKYLRRAIEINHNIEAILQLGYCHELCEEYDLAGMIYQQLKDTSKLLPLRAKMQSR